MARCEKCHGSGLSRQVQEGGYNTFNVCECQGSGIVNCCDTAGAQYTTPEDYWRAQGAENEWEAKTMGLLEVREPPEA